MGWIDSVLNGFSLVFQILIWIYIAGPILVVVPALQISYLGVDISWSKTKLEKFKYRTYRVLMWIPIILWGVGFLGIIAYHALK